MNRNDLKADLRYFESHFRTNLFSNNATYKFFFTHLFTIDAFDFMYKMFSLFNILLKYIFDNFIVFQFIPICKNILGFFEDCFFIFMIS